ncbi:hypothetical protein [Leeia oryzae]|uniref:hypothetical protein n=1 Tax=Leeia oryzae TaxID=356662 RepID=UPI000371A310|nr:hypothetical protein [Leeia oryzae]
MSESFDDAEIDACDALRSADSVWEPDERNAFFASSRSKHAHVSLAVRQQTVAGFKLDNAVPLDIRVHFETAKNLYLYAWFVYRFHPVAEHYALVSLEFALKERLMLLHGENGNKPPRGLSDLLKEASSRQLIRNESFTHRMQWALMRAKGRLTHQKIDQMISSGQDFISYPEEEVILTPEELDFDWLNHFIELIPKIRNGYAHGSSTLDPTVLFTFEIVCDMINQLFAGVQTYTEFHS